MIAMVTMVLISNENGKSGTIQCPTVATETMTMRWAMYDFTCKESEMAFTIVAACNSVTIIMPTVMASAAPIMPSDGWEASQKISAVLTIAPMRLFVIASFAKSSACKTACSGPCK